MFAETARTVVASSGRSGMVLPTGIGTDATTAPFFGDLVKKSALVAFLEFENEAWLLSRAVHHSFRFCLLSMTGTARKVNEASVAFGVRYIADLPERRLTVRPRRPAPRKPEHGDHAAFPVPPRRARSLSASTAACRCSGSDERGRESVGDLVHAAMFHMANDSRLFRTDENLLRDGWKLDGNVFVKGDKRMLPLYEAKMIHHFDHRYGTYEGQTEAQANVGTLPRPTREQKADPDYVIMPRYWVQEWSDKTSGEVQAWQGRLRRGGHQRLESRTGTTAGSWAGAISARSTDERTMICSLLPRTGIGHTFLLSFAGSAHSALLRQPVCRFVLDYVARQKIGGTHLDVLYCQAVPVLPPRCVRSVRLPGTG